MNTVCVVFVLNIFSPNFPSWIASPVTHPVDHPGGMELSSRECMKAATDIENSDEQLAGKVTWALMPYRAADKFMHSHELIEESGE